MRWDKLAGMLLVSGLGAAALAHAQQGDDPGFGDTAIRIGQTMPYSGPASAYGTIGRAEGAYFQMINEHGGVNGRKLRLISLDDSYNPAQTVEQTRRLVEQDDVLFVFQSLGTPSNTAIQKYLNDRRVPQLLVATGATKWGDPRNFPWTMGWQPSYHAEALVYAKYVMRERPSAKIAVLYQNDDYGKDYLNSLKAGLAAKANAIVRAVSYDVTDASIDSQMVSLHGSGADTLFIFATPTFAAQALRRRADMGWEALVVLNVSASVAAVLQPAGLERSAGVITAQYLKDPTDPQWSKDKTFQDWSGWMRRYYPQGDLLDSLNVYGYSAAQTLVQILKQCGDDLSRDNLMRQAANLRDLELPMLLPGIEISTSPEDYYPIEQLQLARFDGRRWVLFGEVLTAESR